MAKKTASKPAPKKISPAAKTRTKSEIFATIADSTMLTKKQVGSVFETLNAMLSADLKKGTVFTLPGMAKFTVRSKPATKARQDQSLHQGTDHHQSQKPSKVVRIRRSRPSRRPPDPSGFRPFCCANGSGRRPRAGLLLFLCLSALPPSIRRLEPKVSPKATTRALSTRCPFASAPRTGSALRPGTPAPGPP